MAGPILVGTSALCVFEAVEASYPMLGVVVDGEAGIEAECGP
jgi:hypothetical protein